MAGPQIKPGKKVEQAFSLPKIISFEKLQKNAKKKRILEKRILMERLRALKEELRADLAKSKRKKATGLRVLKAGLAKSAGKKKAA